MFDNNNKVIKHKVGVLNLAEELGNVSQGCKIMGLSRDTFYRYRAAAAEGGVEVLFDRSRAAHQITNYGLLIIITSEPTKAKCV